MGRPNPTGSSVAGESYPVESAVSVTVTLSMRSHAPALTRARRSANPGLIPDPNTEAPPRSQASAMRRRPSPREWPVMNAAVLTMLLPASRMRTMSSTSTHIGL